MSPPPFRRGKAEELLVPAKDLPQGPQTYLPAGCAPIDGFIGLGIAAGAYYGIRKISSKK